MSLQATINTLVDFPLVPVFYHADPAVCGQVLGACYAGGMHAFEFTNRGTNALETFAELAHHTKQWQGKILGAGTILTGADAEAFIEAGATFIVSPCFIESVSDTCYQNKIPYLPGCMTVKEIHYALQAGSEIIKIFPGEVVGTAFVKAVKAVLPQAQLMVTGGVAPTQQSLQQWFAAGATAVGLGSQLFKKDWLEKREFDQIEALCRQCFEFLTAIKA